MFRDGVRIRDITVNRGKADAALRISFKRTEYYRLNVVHHALREGYALGTGLADMVDTGEELEAGLWFRSRPALRPRVLRCSDDPSQLTRAAFQAAVSEYTTPVLEAALPRLASRTQPSSLATGTATALLTPVFGEFSAAVSAAGGDRQALAAAGQLGERNANEMRQRHNAIADIAVGGKPVGELVGLVAVCAIDASAGHVASMMATRAVSCCMAIALDGRRGRCTNCGPGIRPDPESPTTRVVNANLASRGLQLCPH